MEETNNPVTIDLTNDAEVTYIYFHGRRVVISESCCSESEEEAGNFCGICGSEYETRADVCLECYESERNISSATAVKRCSRRPAEFLDEEGEYCEGFCKECYPSVLYPVVELLKK